MSHNNGMADGSRRLDFKTPGGTDVKGSFASLFVWIETFHTLDNPLKYEDLMEQDFLFEVLHQIDSRPLWTEPVSCAKDSASQIHNASVLTAQLLTCYVDCLSQAVLLPMLDLSTLVSYRVDLNASQQEMRKILLLVLGLVIQSDRKDDFIAVMETLPGDVKEDIMESYKELSSQLVRLDSTEDSSALRRCHADRLTCFKRSSQALREKFYLESVLLSAQTVSGSGPDLLKSLRPPEGLVDFHGYQLLLGSANQQVASLAAQLDDRAAEAAQLTDRLRLKREKARRLKAQLKSLSGSEHALKLKNLIDENERIKDSLRGFDQQRAEMASLRQRLAEFDFFKARVQELRDENGQLLEERQRAEEKLSILRANAEAAADRLAECQLRCEELACQRESATEQAAASARRLAAENRRLREALDALGGADAAAAAAAAAAASASASADSDAASAPSLAAELAAAARIRDLEAEVGRLRSAASAAAPTATPAAAKDGDSEALLAAAERALEKAERRAERLLAERTVAEAAAADNERRLRAAQAERAQAEAAAAARVEAIRRTADEAERRAADAERRLQRLLAERAESAAETETEVVLQASQELAKHLARLGGNNRTLRQSCDKLKAELTRLAGVELEVLELRSARDADSRLLHRLEAENRQLRRTLDTQSCQSPPTPMKTTAGPRHRAAAPAPVSKAATNPSSMTSTSEGGPATVASIGKRAGATRQPTKQS